MLKELSLYGNSIADAGAEALAGALHVKAVLTTLFLNGNNIKENGSNQLRDAVQGRVGFNLYL